ncbi:MAG: DUF3365 domain-containing protein [Calothrix sp. SM1_5_4]|nr:DUF3365 domain-containing protein [Calothrix sp. SM1_5_4]
MKTVLLAVLLLESIVHSAHAGPLDGAVAKLEEINTMRESLAATLENDKNPITEETFKRVCAPVGQALKSWADAEGYVARQLSEKYRNPKNKAEGHDLEIAKEFARKKDRMYIVEQVGDTMQIYRRINVQTSCLRCHGDSKTAPEFIKNKYPKDLANGFAPGALRGIYSVRLKR